VPSIRTFFSRSSAALTSSLYIGEILIQPRMLAGYVFCKQGVLATQDSSGLGRSDAAKGGTKSFSQTEPLLVLAVLLLDDEALPINANSPRGKAEKIDLLLEDERID
jgi:hypothetical protein